ncbi:MAG: hypothetical protein U1F56_21210 [Rubrivivax sp.]
MATRTTRSATVRRPPASKAPKPAPRLRKASPAASVESDPPAPAPAPAPAAATKADKPPKAPKLRRKPVRDSFTMPPADFALIATLKARTLAAGRETRKSELLRAGLQALDALDTPALLAALGRLEAIKVGRPKKGH